MLKKWGRILNRPKARQICLRSVVPAQSLKDLKYQKLLHSGGLSGLNIVDGWMAQLQ